MSSSTLICQAFLIIAIFGFQSLQSLRIISFKTEAIHNSRISKYTASKDTISYLVSDHLDHDHLQAWIEIYLLILSDYRSTTNSSILPKIHEILLLPSHPHQFDNGGMIFNKSWKLEQYMPHKCTKCSF